MIEVSELFFGYHRKEVLKGISFNLAPGQLTSIIGPNGSGKSTLLKCINKILKPGHGHISLLGRRLDEIRLRDLAKYIGYVPQFETGAFPFTVFETVLMGRRPHIGWNVSKNDLKAVDDTLSHLKLDDLKHCLLDELSGGERQRVLIARALAKQPTIMLLDEPTSNLDPRHQLQLFELIMELTRKKGILMVCAIHDLHLAARYSDNIIMLRNGKVFAQGPPSAVLTPVNLEAVYQIEAFIHRDNGCFHVLPQKVIGNMAGSKIEGA